VDTVEAGLREAIIGQCRWMNAIGLNQGTSGNISARHGEAMLITPSATPYERMMPEMIVRMPLSAPDGAWDGPLKPSTEWRFHRDILRARPDVGAVVHTHSTFATVLSIARREIPACHYMIAAFGGPTVRCADYATYGTAELSRNALAALEGRNGCLLANHGMIAAGPNLDKAMWLAVELETIAKQYFHALQIGAPVILDDAEIGRVREGFRSYGLQDRAPAGAAQERAGTG
jgi:L-fuculose-phosphate aldolase